jgi:hypothetical protein
MTRLLGDDTHAMVLSIFFRLKNDAPRYRMDTEDAGQGPMAILVTFGLAHAPIWVQAGEEIMTLRMESPDVWNMR